MSTKPEINILLVAMDQELGSIAHSYSHNAVTLNSTTIAKAYSIELKNNWIVLKTGVGPINTALCLGELASSYDINNLVQFGIGGALTSELNVGDYVIGDSVIQHDAYFKDEKTTQLMGTGQLFLSRVTDVDPKIKTSTKITTLLENFCKTKSLTFKTGGVASGSSFISNVALKKEINQSTNAIMVEMESAAAAFFANENAIPYGFIKVCSDSINKDSHNEYKEFLNQNIELAPTLLGFFDENI